MTQPADIEAELAERERIETAAVRYFGVVYTLDRPARHHDVLGHIVNVALRKPLEIDPASGRRGEQGFVTSTGRFVDRQEAMRIAKASGQPFEREPTHADTLLSEDLW